MAQIISSPNLYEKIALKNHLHRALDLVILALLFTLLVYRFVTLKNHGFAWFLAILCELWFTFTWIIIVSTKWNRVKYKTYPELISQSVEEHLPSVDMFVTTANSVLEPPIITMNTVLSLLAVDYPANKLACYLSDDGCSAVTYYSLVETAKFAKHWVPFCKKYNVQIRAPFRYFSCKSMSSSTHSSLDEFHKEWTEMKDMYEELSSKIEDASRKSNLRDQIKDLPIFSNIDRKNHPTIIEVIWENKENLSDGIPHLIYISREKNQNHPHHYKAGAMNVLARVSGLITNAPFMLNVDCDMYANNPQIVRQAMCFFFNSNEKCDFAFVQFPQMFYDELKDDPFGNTLQVLYKYMGHGIAGLQGPFYGGTGCFHRRKVIYGLCPNDKKIQPITSPSPVSGNLNDKDLIKLFGSSKEFIKLAAEALEGKTNNAINFGNSMKAAYEVANCGYENGTAWGDEVGWQYGSLTEDILTGLKIHSRGWKSALCTPNPPGFLGCSPSCGPAAMTQQKRWATGLLEILVSKKSPMIATIKAKLQFRQCLAYLWVLIWGLRSIPELCYMLLPAYSILTRTNFLPKFDEPVMLGYVSLITFYSFYTILEYIKTGLPMVAWWNKLRMARITTTCAWLFGVLSVVLKVLGISETVFEVTQKDQSSDVGKFTFDGSPIYVPGTMILLVQLGALFVGLFGSIGDHRRLIRAQFGEIFCSLIVVIFLWPFVKGLFRQGKYGIPFSIICKSVVLSLCFVHFCNFASGFLWIKT